MQCAGYACVRPATLICTGCQESPACFRHIQTGCKTCGKLKSKKLPTACKDCRNLSLAAGCKTCGKGLKPKKLPVANLHLRALGVSEEEEEVANSTLVETEAEAKIAQQSPPKIKRLVQEKFLTEFEGGAKFEFGPWLECAEVRPFKAVSKKDVPKWRSNKTIAGRIVVRQLTAGQEPLRLHEDPNHPLSITHLETALSRLGIKMTVAQLIPHTGLYCPGFPKSEKSGDTEDANVYLNTIDGTLFLMFVLIAYLCHLRKWSIQYDSWVFLDPTIGEYVPTERMTVEKQELADRLLLQEDGRSSPRSLLLYLTGMRFDKGAKKNYASMYLALGAERPTQANFVAFGSNPLRLTIGLTTHAVRNMCSHVAEIYALGFRILPTRYIRGKDEKQKITIVDSATIDVVRARPWTDVAYVDELKGEKLLGVGALPLRDFVLEPMGRLFGPIIPATHVFSPPP